MPPKAKAKPEAKAKPAAKAEAAKPKPKPKKEKEEEPILPTVPKPNYDAQDEDWKNRSKEIDELQTKVAELNSEINKKNPNSEIQMKRRELLDKLAVIREAIGDLNNKKKEFQGQMDKTKAEGQQARMELKKTKDSLACKSEEEIDERLRTIEIEMKVKTLSLREEKQLMKEIAQLKKDKPKVAQLSSMQNKVDNLNPGTDIRQSLTDINGSLKLEFEKRDVLQAELTKLTEQNKGSEEERQKLFDKRKELQDDISAKIKERQAKKQEFLEQVAAYKKNQEEIRQLKEERWRKEREERQAEYEKKRRAEEREKMNEEPHVTERTLLEQCILFCKSMMPKSDDKADDDKDEKKETKEFETEGLTLLTKKEDRDEFYFAPTKKKGQAKNKKSGGKKEDGSQAIKHNIETFTLFDKLKISAPMTVDELPATLEKLEQELEGYREKVKQWEAKMADLKRREELGLPIEEEKKPEEEKKEEAQEDEKEAEEPAAAADEEKDEEETKEEAEEKTDEKEEAAEDAGEADS